MDYILTRLDGTIDLTKPTRITQARIIVRPSQNKWALGQCFLEVDCFSFFMRE
jgi:hypothetical protein